MPEPEPLGRPALAGKDGRHPLESGWRFWYEAAGKPHTPEGAGAAGSPTGVGKNGKVARPAAGGAVPVAPFATLEDFWIQVMLGNDRGFCWNEQRWPPPLVPFATARLPSHRRRLMLASCSPSSPLHASGPVLLETNEPTPNLELTDHTNTSPLCFDTSPLF